MIKINAAKVSDPLAAVRDAVERGEGEIEFSSRDAGPASKVMGFLEDRGFRVQLQDDDGLLTLSAKRETEPSRPAASRKPVHPERKAPVASASIQVHAPVAAPVPAPATARFPVEVPSRPPLPEAHREERGLTVLVMGRTLGRGNPELEEIVIKEFLSAFAQSNIPPENVVLLNEGVRLALFDTSTCDHLKDMEAKGTRVLVSDVCAGRLDITGDIGVGVIANMLDILDVIHHAGNILQL